MDRNRSTSLRGGTAILAVIGVMLMGWSSGGLAADSSRHACAGAGRWYPAEPDDLRATITRYLMGAKTDRPEGRIGAIVVPHAGYTYCGPVAAEAFKTLQGRTDIRRVIILAFSHSYPVRGISVLDVEAYETPLGDVPVDREVVQALLKNPLFDSVPAAHRTEHSDENQLPFLQVVLGNNFKLVSLFVGSLGGDDFDGAAETIRPFVDEHTVLVVSSDFTHYGDAYGFDPFHGKNVKDRMYALDQGAIDRICRKEFSGFRGYIQETGATICGVQPISLLLKTLPADAEGHLLRYQTSADATGDDYSMAVGYAAIVFNEEEATTGTQKSAAAAADKPGGADPAVNPAASEVPALELQGLHLLHAEEQSTLLLLARRTLESALEHDPPGIGTEIDPVVFGDFNLTETLRARHGAFVTLTTEGDLRGCIGYIVGRESLYQAVMHNAVNAAFHDPRFLPLTQAELKKVHIEISVLGPLEDVRPEDVVVGRDGLVISGQGRSGVLLPQVPVEQGWTRTEFLDYVCRKAGLPRGAWREGTRLQRFGAQVFGEE